MSLKRNQKNRRKVGEVGMKEFIVPTEIPEEIEFYEEHKCQEIVRCKNCKRRGTYQCPVYVGGDGMCSEPDDWFCADGERREE